MEIKEYIKTSLDKLNLLGMKTYEDENKKVINNIMGMPQDMLSDMENEQILGMILDNLGLFLNNNKEKYELSINGIYSFDMEFFNTDTMYTDFLNYINTLTNDELKISVIREDTSNVNYESGTGIQIIEFNMLDQKYKYEAKVKYDWFDVGIISFLNKIIKDEKGNKFLYVTCDGWQNCIVFYNTDKWAEKFNEYFQELQIKKV